MIRIRSDATFKKWIAGLTTLDPGDQVERGWQQETDLFFGRTQTFAHVISGAMKASGESSVSRSGDQVIGEIAYGGGGVDYTIYELRRGGAHDFYARAWAGMPTRYRDTLIDSIDQAVGQVAR